MPHRPDGRPAGAPTVTSSRCQALFGARSVKWLGGIRVQEQPSENHFQLRSDRLFAPQIRPPDVEPSSSTVPGETVCPPAGRQMPAFTPDPLLYVRNHGTGTRA